MNAYDIDNRLTNRAAIGYQASYAYNRLGWRTNMVDVSGTNAYQYDVLGELTNKMVSWAGGPTVSLNYRYDAIGPVTNLWTSTVNGVTNAYVYDNLGRLTNVVAGSTMAASYQYDIVGNLQAIGYAAGVTNLYQYDALNRVTNAVWRVGNTALASFGYTLGPTGNRTNLAETVNGASRSYNWTYDSLYRLTGETIANAGTVNYAYDAVGNRTNRASTIAQLPANSPAYTANDWLASDTYDPNGNTTASGTASYQYDALNHLTNVNSGAILITYDADGNRASKKVGTTTTYYLLDDRNPSGYVQVLEEWTVVGTSTNLAKAYNYGLDLISQRVPSTSTNYFIYDGHGSARVLTDNAGHVANTFTYDAYGTLIASNTTAQTAYLYSGQQFDADLGFYYNRARYLNVGTGRFWTMDTDEGDQEDPLSLHKYLYCQEDPVDGYDPSGLYTQKFGYAVEKLIRAKYALEHSGQDVNRTGGPIGAGNNPALRPDIWNKSSNPKTYAEIKPLSISGIAHGIGQLNTYERSLKDFGYVRDKWPSGIRTDYYNCQPFFYFNINGLILYTTIEPLVVPALFPAAKALAESQAAQLAKGVVTTLNDVVGKEAMQAVEASSLEVEDGVATVALTEDL